MDRIAISDKPRPTESVAARVPRGPGDRAVAVGLSAWALGGTVLTAQVWLWSRLQGLEKAWWECLIVAVPDLAIWAVIVPVAMWLARRVPVGPEAWARPIGLHLPLGVLAALGATLAHGALAVALGWLEPGAELAAVMRVRIPLHLPTGVALYAAVVLGTRLVGDSRSGAAAEPPTVDRSRSEAAELPLGVPTSAGLQLVAAREIDWVEADRNYVVLHRDGRTDRLRSTMAELERRLPEQFVRIHRSRIVNLDRVEAARRWRNGDWIVVLRDGTRLPLSRTHRRAFEARLDGRL